METFQGKLQAKGLRIGIIVSRFNQFISERLLEGSLDALQKLGAEDANISVYKVPGSFEVPLLSAEVTKGLAQISIEDGLPVSFGILTVDTIEQGIERAGAKAGNKGSDAAFSLVETINLLKTSGLK